MSSLYKSFHGPACSSIHCTNLGSVRFSSCDLAPTGREKRETAFGASLLGSSKTRTGHSADRNVCLENWSNKPRTCSRSLQGSAEAATLATCGHPGQLTKGLARPRGDLFGWTSSGPHVGCHVLNSHTERLRVVHPRGPCFGHLLPQAVGTNIVRRDGQPCPGLEKMVEWRSFSCTIIIGQRGVDTQSIGLGGAKNCLNQEFLFFEDAICQNETHCKQPHSSVTGRIVRSSSYESIHATRSLEFQTWGPLRHTAGESLQEVPACKLPAAPGGQKNIHRIDPNRPPGRSTSEGQPGSISVKKHLFRTRVNRAPVLDPYCPYL